MLDLPRHPGIHYLEFAKPESRATLLIPPNFRDDLTFGLVIALHYAGPATPFFGASILTGLIEPGLRELGAIIAAPDCQAGTWDNERSEDQVLELIELLTGYYPIDPKSILLTGYSIGGIGTWYIGSSNQTVFAAAIPMAARPPRSAAQTNWTLPLHVIHGRRDELFPIQDTRDIVQELVLQGAEISLEEVEEASHFETGRYYRPLKKSVPWIRKCWSRDN